MLPQKSTLQGGDTSEFTGFETKLIFYYADMKIIFRTYFYTIHMV